MLCVSLVLELTSFYNAADEEWEIDKAELTLGRELGSGQFGVRKFNDVLFTLRVCVRSEMPSWERVHTLTSHI